MRIAFLTDNYSEAPERLDPFRFELLKEFAPRSSSLLYVQCNDYLSDDGVFRSRRIEKHFLKKLKDFSPDLVFSLNRAGLNAPVTDSLSCPVFSWFIDNPNRFSNHLRTYARNETIFCATRYMMSWISRNTSHRGRVAYLPFCTNPSLFSPAPASGKACDVSYVGTLWDPRHTVQFISDAICKTPEDKSWFEARLDRYLSDYDYPIEREIAHRMNDPMELVWIKNAIDDFLSTRSRLQVLGTLSDLDLEIYGTRSWSGNSLLWSNALFKKVSLTPIQTPNALAELYRRSRVCLSISHHQAQTGFPIRIFDILACGSPLVTDRHSELEELFEAGRSFLAYDTPEEARECVLRVLKDPAQAARMRSSTVEEVREKHTFAARVRQVLGKDAVERNHAKVEVLSRRFDPNPLLAALSARKDPTRRATVYVAKDTPLARPDSIGPLQKAGHILGTTFHTGFVALRFLVVYRGTVRKDGLEQKKTAFVFRLFKPIGRIYLNLLKEACQHMQTRLELQKEDSRRTYFGHSPGNP